MSGRKQRSPNTVTANALLFDSSKMDPLPGLYSWFVHELLHENSRLDNSFTHLTDTLLITYLFVLIFAKQMDSLKELNIDY